MKKISLLVLLFLQSFTYWHSEYYPTIDLSTGCQSFPVLESDVSLSRNENILSLAANPKKRGGVYVGSIAAKTYQFQDGSTYTLSGSLRKASGTPEQIDVNIQWVDESYIEHYSEIIWSLNPYSPLYGWVWTRNGGDPILLYKLGDDTEWHDFSITASHQGDKHTIEKISIDGHEFHLGIPEGTLVKTYSDRLTVLLEVQNSYTNCDGLISSQAAAEWMDVELQWEYGTAGKQ